VGKDIAICPAFREERGTRCARRAKRVIAFADGGEVDGGEPARCWRVEIWAARVGPDKPPMNRLGWIMVTTPSSFACMPRLRPRPARRSTAAVRSCHANRTGLAVEAALYRPCALRWFNSTGPYISTVPQRVTLMQFDCGSTLVRLRSIIASHHFLLLRHQQQEENENDNESRKENEIFEMSVQDISYYSLPFQIVDID
jgi:hypothetical protein